MVSPLVTLVVSITNILLEKNISITDWRTFDADEHIIEFVIDQRQCTDMPLAVSNFTSCNWWDRLIGGVLRFMRWHGPATSAPAATYSANAPRESILLYDCGQSYILIELVRYAEPSVSNGILPPFICARETTTRSAEIFVSKKENELNTPK